MQEKYDLIAIMTISLLLYGLSYLLVKSGILNRVYHRRFWNTLLLVSFIVAGGLGITDWDGSGVFEAVARNDAVVGVGRRHQYCRVVRAALDVVIWRVRIQCRKFLRVVR